MTNKPVVIASAERSLVRLVVNGAQREGFASPRTSLADFLRHELGLHGTHIGCEHGVCGACTVVLDGAPSLSCLVLAVSADGAGVRTVEGLASGPDEKDLAPLQRAFREHFAVQCGFCTAGMLMAGTALLDENPVPTRGDVEEAVSGVLCRCTGYAPIIEAILDASRASHVQAARSVSPSSVPRDGGDD